MPGRLTAEHRSRLERLWADGGYRNHRRDARPKRSGAGSVIGVVRRPAGGKGFAPLHRRGVVERTLGWLGRDRRHRRDDGWHTHPSEARAWVSSVHRTLRLLEPDRSEQPVPFKYRESQGKITG